ncbi:hypothetical protein [Microbacterium sp. NPDC057650]|uniref:hypothetical protein n=1 Tax=unclassified Microbacterium TaxID=2609290 RepID=UPI003672730B
MPHDDLTVDDVLELVIERRPATSQARRTSEGELGFVLYDAFSVRGHYDDYGRGNWGFSIAVGDDSVARVLGQRLTLCGTRAEVRAALDAIDGYARLRLGPEYLAAFAAAYGERLG